MTSMSEQIARDMRDGTFPKKSETTKSEDRARIAYDAFRNGFGGGVLPPEWDKAPSWVRDAIHVAYLQGKLDDHGVALAKRPVAFRLPEKDGWVILQNEQAAQIEAEHRGIQYQGLYVRDGNL